MKATADTSAIDELQRELGQLEDLELEEAGRRGAEAAFTAEGVPVESGELAASRYVHLQGKELEAGFNSRHQSSARQRARILPDADKLGDAALEAMGRELERALDKIA